MMLQGHFVDTMLAEQFRDPNHWLFSSWFFMRGITAPVFFFSAGLVFTYLMSRSTKPWRENDRLFKGLTRVGQLLFLGYLLRINFPALIFRIQLYPWFWGADVLQVIGLALLAVIGLFIVHKETRLSLSALLGGAGLLVFFLEPAVKTGPWNALPDGIAGYLVNRGFSTFTLFPWIGYTLLGGMGGALLARRPQVAQHSLLPVGLLATGLVLHFFSIQAIGALYDATGVEAFRQWRVQNSHLLVRLGDVWVAMALIIWITRLWKTMPALIPKIGQETLLIYGVHYVVLFGTWFGLGISMMGKESWSPALVIPGAILFVLSFVYLIHRLETVENRVRTLRRRAQVFGLTSLRLAGFLGLQILLPMVQRVYVRAMPYLRLYRMRIRP